MYLYICYVYILNSRTVCTGVKAGVGQLYSEEKTETLCWLCDKYGHLERKYMLINFSLIRPYQDDDRMITVE